MLAVFTFAKSANAQMMGLGSNAQVSQDQINSEQKEQDEGQVIYQKLQGKQVTCQQLTDDNFDKLGDYFMWRALGSTQTHAAMDEQITQMMGEQGNTQMHIILGKRGSGCFSNLPIPSNTPSFMMGMMNNVYTNGGGVNIMMGFGYGSMMGNFGVLGGYLAIVVWAVVLIDLILLGVWLFKKIQK